ncbi:MAG: NAD(P)/FAD-dependent oxidoreductase [Candidatus Acidiferrales bacterium]
MNAPRFDLVTVGGGLAASALGKAVAERGAKVLIIEQETRFKDRVRGELLSSWGVAEAKHLGLFEFLVKTCAAEIPWVDLGFGPRELPATTICKLPAISYSHPEMQEALLQAAEESGAEVRRGITVKGVETGPSPAVLVASGSHTEKISARLVAAADGRGSAVRKWAGFTSQKNLQPYLFAGVLMSGVAARHDLAWLVFNPGNGMVVGTIPITKDRFRSYLGYSNSANYRLQGHGSFDLFRSECAKALPLAGDFYAHAEPIGPLASFDGGDSWVEHPYREGVALLGDAAATSDPTFGQGMPFAFRDARTLRDHLLRESDWDRAGHLYAEQHDAAYRNCHAVMGWLRTVFQEQTPEASRIREKALPLIDEDMTRVPDHLFDGPELPADDSVRARFFGEI